jgi:hypothetical protein
MQQSQSLIDLQQELLKLYASNTEDADLLHIRRYLAKYFADKAIQEADKIGDEKKYSNEIMDQWLNEDDDNYGKNGSKS